MGLLSKAQILRAPLRSQVVPVPEWSDGNGNDAVRVRELTLAEHKRIFKQRPPEALADDAPEMVDIALQIVAASVIDDRGVQLFSEEDANALAQRSLKTIHRVARVAMELTALDQETVAKNS
jgi:hypothetical protein